VTRNEKSNQLTKSETLALVGLALCISAYPTSSWLRAFRFPNDRWEQEAYSSAQVRRDISGCKVDLEEFDHALTLHESVNLIADVSLPPSVRHCESEVTVEAAAFDTKPDKIECELNEKSNETQKIYFSILPNAAGSQTIVFTNSMEGGRRSRIMDVTVSEYPHVPPSVSRWFPPLQAVFGGMITIPYWIQLIAGRKKRKTKGEKGSPS
jgi:hypothetical protein